MIKLSKRLLFNGLIGIAFVFVMAVYLNPSRLNKVFEIDACMESGGQWDYQRKVCEGGK